MVGSRHIVTLVLAGDSSKLRKTFADSKQIIAAGFAAAGVAAVTMVGASIGAFKEFQTSLNQVEAVSGATGAQMGRLKTQALEMGASTKFSANEAAGAMGFLAQAGLSVDETMGALPATLNLAAAGNLDLATAADLATNVMSGFGLGVGELAHVTDAMAVSAASANVSVAQVGAAMTYVGPVASAAGLSLDEVTAAIGLLGNAGFQGEMGGTALRGAITKLINPSREGAAILEKLGIKALDSSGKMLPLETIVEQLGASGLTAGEAMEIFGQRAGPGMLALVSQGAPALRELTASIQDSDGAAAAMAETQQKGLVGAMTQLTSATGNLLIILGDQFAPLVSTLAGYVTEAARGVAVWVQESDGLKRALGGMQSVLSGSMSLIVKYKDTLMLIGRAVVGGAAGFLAYKAANLAYATGQAVATAAMWLWNTAFTVGTGGINLIVPAIVAIGVAMFMWGGQIKTFLSGVWNKLVGGMNAVLRPFRAIGDLMGITLPGNLDRFKIKTEQVSRVTLPDFATSLGEAKTQLKQAEDGIADMLEAGMDPDQELLDWVEELRSRVDDLSRFTMPEFASSLEDAKTQLDQAEQGMQQMRDAGMDVDAKMVEWTDSLRDHVDVLENRLQRGRATGHRCCSRGG